MKQIRRILDGQTFQWITFFRRANKLAYRYIIRMVLAYCPIDETTTGLNKLHATSKLVDTNIDLMRTRLIAPLFRHFYDLDCIWHSVFVPFGCAHFAIRSKSLISSISIYLSIGCIIRFFCLVRAHMENDSIVCYCPFFIRWLSCYLADIYTRN